MATYFVRTDGKDGNTGLGAGTGQAWATIGKALGATGITGGDTVYIAPGTYREVVTIGGTYASNTFIYGDPTASLFSGVTAGEVRITPSGSDNTVSTSFALTATSKDNLNFRDLIIGGMNITTSSNMTIERCMLFSTSATTQAFVFTTAYATVNHNTTIKQSIITGTVAGIEYKYYNFSAPWTAGLYISDCFITGSDAVYLNNIQGFALYPAGSIVIYNSVLMGYRPFVMPANYQTGTSTGNNIKIYNCVVYATGTYAFQCAQPSGVDDNYNRIYGSNTRLNVSQGANTTVASWPGLEFGQSLLQGYGPIQIFGNTFNSPNATAGTASGAPLVDMYNQSWNVTPDVGLAKFRTIGGTGVYQPAAQSSTTLTIAPNSTSQSVEVFLGVTGLTATTAGLVARYNKNRTVDVAIPLVARTISQPWVAGGFAEVNPTTMPGVYRLDIPNEAITTGYGIATVVVRGTSATNGAVLTIQETPTLGYQIKMGPFTVQADGILTDDRLKLIQGSVHSIDFKMVDAYGTGVDGTGTVVTAKVYNAAGFLIDTYTCTAMYALDGRYSFAIDSTVTDNVGMYTINIYRQIGTETNVFGRMKLEVLSP